MLYIVCVSDVEAEHRDNNLVFDDRKPYMQASELTNISRAYPPQSAATLASSIMW